MRLTRTNVYALRACVQLAAAPRGLPIPASKLAREGKMPERFLLQVLRVLVRHQILKSNCGVAGGYYLARSPERISLRDLFEPFDDASKRAAKMLQGVSDEVRGRIVGYMHAAADAGRQHLQKVSLAEIARGSSARNDASIGSLDGGDWPIRFVIPTKPRFEGLPATR